MEIVEGNLLDYASPFSFIAHQCNCWAKRPKHLSAQVFGKFPHANIYGDGTKRVPGNIIVRGPVINMLAQNSFGKAGRYDPKESYPMRREWLRQCLDKILSKKDIKTVYFPYGLGCGAAGDNWIFVEPIFQEFGIAMKAEGRTAYFVRFS
jgi:hypothetical protein